MTIPRFPALLLGALTLSLALPACGKNLVEPAFATEGHRMVIIPMKGRLQPSFEDPAGLKLAELLADHLEAKRKELDPDEVIEAVSYEDMVAAVTKVHEAPQELKPEDIGRSVNADLVLTGEIERFGPVPGDVAIWRGLAKVRLKVIDVARPERTFYRSTITVKYPREGIGQTGIMASDAGGREELEAGLMAELVGEIGKLFYVHEAEDDRH